MKLEASGGIGVMSIDTDRNNAINLESIAEAHELMDEAEHNPSIRALVVTAENPPLFCPGVDIVSLVDADRPTMERFFAELSGLVRRKFSYPLPEVYALNGHTIAGGFMMAAAGDDRLLLGKRSQVGLMEVNLGLAAPIGVVQMLVHGFGGVWPSVCSAPVGCSRRTSQSILVLSTNWSVPSTCCWSGPPPGPVRWQPSPKPVASG